jgi:hypothetical protein
MNLVAPVDDQKRLIVNANHDLARSSADQPQNKFKLKTESPCSLNIVKRAKGVSRKTDDVVIKFVVNLQFECNEALNNPGRATLSNEKNTMAMFANQASNLSALVSKFDRLLKVRNPNEGSEGCFRSTGANTEELPRIAHHSLIFQVF